MAQESQASPPPVSATDDSSGSRKRSGAVIAFLTFGVYLLLPTRESYWDAVGFAQTIEASRGSPNHLLHNLMGYALWKAAAAAGMTVRALKSNPETSRRRDPREIIRILGVLVTWR